MHDYVNLQTAILLRRMAYQVNHAAKQTDEEAVHDLRVSIRRLSRCLRLFSHFYPGSSWKKVRHRLKQLMDAAGEVRDRDITLKLLAEAGVPLKSALLKQLAAERKNAAKELAQHCREWKQSSYSKKWRNRLHVEKV